VTNVAKVDTSGLGIVSSISYSVFIIASLRAALPLVARMRERPPVVPVAAIVLWLVVAIPSLLQFGIPTVYEALYRNRDAILDSGQWWRVATAIVVQDGGLYGTLFNLILLGIAAYVSCKLWGSTITVTLFVVVGVGLNVLAVAFSAGDGGGNSGATFPLVSSFAVLAVVVLHGAQRRIALILALLITAIGIYLVIANDGHGIAILVGIVVGGIAAVFLKSSPRLAVPISELEE
jgi:hypothetical protein